MGWINHIAIRLSNTRQRVSFKQYPPISLILRDDGKPGHHFLNRSASNIPTHILNRLGSMDRHLVCRGSAALTFSRPFFADGSIRVTHGRPSCFAFHSVMGTTRRTGTRSISFELMTNAGRIFCISLPNAGSRSTRHTSPLFGSGKEAITFPARVLRYILRLLGP